MSDNFRDILKGAIEHFGPISQKIKAIEELSELTVELARELNTDGKSVAILEEIADATIMIGQLQLIYGEDNVDFFIQKKLDDLSRLIQTP